MTVADICKQNDISLEQVKKALISLSAKGLIEPVSDLAPGTIIKITQTGELYFR